MIKNLLSCISIKIQFDEGIYDIYGTCDVMGHTTRHMNNEDNTNIRLMNINIPGQDPGKVD